MAIEREQETGDACKFITTFFLTCYSHKSYQCIKACNACNLLHLNLHFKVPLLPSGPTGRGKKGKAPLQLHYHPLGSFEIFLSPKPRPFL